MKKIGITTTVPVEVIYAAGYQPVDLNNIFITAPNAPALVEEAELAGYPRNICAWIKGIYTVALENKDINCVIAVTQGDCSNTHALMETLQVKGMEIIPFAFPYDRDYDMLKLQIEKLMHSFGVSWQQVKEQKKRLDEVRGKVFELDRRTWVDNSVSGFHNHLYQVSCSDFNGNPEEFALDVDRFLEENSYTPRQSKEIRLGYIGVPPIMTDLYNYVEERGARIVYNEVQRQFTMPFEREDLVEQYRLYTYPYDIFWRLQDIKREVANRHLDGIIHYAQSFCYRHIQDLIIRSELNLPILTLEGDRPVRVDARTKMRIDAFLDILR